MRGTLMVVATIITTITFQPIVNPPGGVWQADVDFGVNWGLNKTITCEAGTSVLACKPDYYYQYFIFMICNTVSFTASLCVTFLLISGFPLGNKVCMGLLTFAMCTTLAFLGVTYLIAFFMLVPEEIFAVIYLDGDANAFFIRYCVLYSLMAVIGVVLLIHTIRFLVWLGMKIRKFALYMQRR
ncbi:ankyrin repeat-containing protein BDA1-like [Fagus crenata]